MRLGNPILAVHNALARAIHEDLPLITYENRDWPAWQKLSKIEQADAIRTRTEPKVKLTRRPTDDDVDVFVFPQTWGSTALGYGGMGGAAVTDAYTVVVRDHNCYCVYFGQGELAYKIKCNILDTNGKANLTHDIHNHRMADRASAALRYSVAL